MRQRMMMVAAVMALAGAASGAQAAPCAAGAAGFSVLETRDLSRAYRYEHDAGDPHAGADGDAAAAPGRPMQIGLWYPAAATDGENMTLRAYIRAGATADTLAVGAAAEREADAAVRAVETSVLYDPAVVQAVLDEPTAAVADAPVRPGRRPVVVMAMGSGAPWYNNYALAEALASCGYVVLASRSAARVAPLMSLDADGVETAARDLEFLIAQAAALEYADITRVGVIGRSWGATGAIVFAARNQHVDALVSLDGTISYNADTLRGEHALGGFDSAEDVRAPIFVAVGADRREGATPIDAVSYFEAVENADAYHAVFPQMTHAAFASRFLALDYRAFHDDARRARFEGLRAGYDRMVADVARFLDHYVAGTGEGLAAFDPSALREIEADPADHALDDPYAFERLAMDYGMAAAVARYETVMATAPADHRMFGWRSLDNLATYFVERGRLEDLLTLAAFAEAAYPDRAVFAVREGHGRLVLGDREGAMRAFRRAQQIDPDDAYARAYLARLESGG